MGIRYEEIIDILVGSIGKDSITLAGKIITPIFDVFTQPAIEGTKTSIEPI